MNLPLEPPNSCKRVVKPITSASGCESTKAVGGYCFPVRILVAYDGDVLASVGQESISLAIFSCFRSWVWDVPFVNPHLFLGWSMLVLMYSLHSLKLFFRWLYPTSSLVLSDLSWSIIQFPGHVPCQTSLQHRRNFGLLMGPFIVENPKARAAFFNRRDGIPTFWTFKHSAVLIQEIYREPVSHPYISKRCPHVFPISSPVGFVWS